MSWISWRCARTAAQVLCTTIAVGGSGCADAAPEAAREGASLSTPPEYSPGPLPPPAEAGPAAMAVATVPAPEAGLQIADAAVAAPVVAPLDAVDANGVRGALVDMPFLADMGDGKKNLMLVDWEIPAGKEVYLCGRVTVPEDLYFSASYPVNPLGTHHTAMSVLEKPNAPDGVTLCDASEVGRRSVGGSGVGTGGGSCRQASP